MAVVGFGLWVGVKPTAESMGPVVRGDGATVEVVVGVVMVVVVVVEGGFVPNRGVGVENGKMVEGEWWFGSVIAISVSGCLCGTGIDKCDYESSVATAVNWRTRADQAIASNLWLTTKKRLPLS
jgi:hypothetical protein